MFISKAIEDEEGTFHLEVLNTVTFREQNGKTVVRLHARVIKATPNAAEALSGMEQGWSGSLGKLEQHLSVLT